MSQKKQLQLDDPQLEEQVQRLCEELRQEQPDTRVFLDDYSASGGKTPPPRT